jgi:hypothetical protein
MMRQVVSILFIAVFLIQLMGKTFVTAHYLLNKEQISRTLCENKTKPSKKCHGKCQLIKKLRHQKQAEGNTPVSIPEVLKGKTECPAVLTEITVSLTSSAESRTVFPAYLLTQTTVHYADIFHPPCC